MTQKFKRETDNTVHLHTMLANIRSCVNIRNVCQTAHLFHHTAGLHTCISVDCSRVTANLFLYPACPCPPENKHHIVNCGLLSIQSCCYSF